MNNLNQESQSLSTEDKRLLLHLLENKKHRWNLNARDKQRLPLGQWITWLILAGRGFGKTRTGSETVRMWSKHYPLINIVGATASDVRDIQIIGESGLLSVFPKDERPVYKPSTRSVHFQNGAKAMVFSADEPERLRGHQCYKAWSDELAAWRYPEAYDQLMLGLRLGDNPQIIITTTPKPTKLIRELAKDSNTVLTTGTTYENRTNLAPAFFDYVIKQYEGTRIGRQELNAEILEDIEGALWNNALIDGTRVKECPELRRIVVAVDPAVTSKPTSDATGIVVVGIDEFDEGYVLEDATNIYTPGQWANKVVYLYYKYNADRVIGEVNNGGDMIESTLRSADKTISYKSVYATRGKYIRAEPIVALYEKNRVHHVGALPELETEMTTWAPELKLDSPNRMDALVWGLTELMLNAKIIKFI